MSGEPEHLAEGTLISHLLELRNRLIRSAIAVLICFAPCGYYANELFTFIANPLLQKLPKGATLIATGVVSPFMTPFKLAMFVAVFLAMPYILYQIWAFVAPGLYKREKRFAVPLLISSVVLFYIGVGFAYQFVFPPMFAFFAETTPKGVAMMTDISQYLDFAMTMFFAFGVAFETPIAVVLMVLTGLVSMEKLRRSRGYVLIGIFILAAILTPPNVVSQLMMAIPMYALYEGGLLMAYLLSKMKRENTESEEGANA